MERRFDSGNIPPIKVFPASIQIFLNSIDRVCKAEYVATVEDILYIRKEAKNVEVQDFNIAPGCRYRIYDVRASLNSKPYWAPYFDDIHLILYVVDVSSFDEAIAENNGITRLVESLMFFESICENPLLKEADITILFNKVDVLTAKLEYASVHRFFRDYNGTQSVSSVIDYFGKRFSRCNKYQGRNVRYMMGTAVHADSASHLFQQLHDHLGVRIKDKVK